MRKNDSKVLPPIVSIKRHKLLAACRSVNLDEEDAKNVSTKQVTSTVKSRPGKPHDSQLLSKSSLLKVNSLSYSHLLKLCHSNAKAPVRHWLRSVPRF